jgi:ribonuclease P protein component
MNRRYRLTSTTDFKRVRRTGKSYAHPLAIVFVSPNALPNSRFGVTAGRELGNAVHRNRAKRLLREVLRNYLALTLSGWDIVLVARPALIEADSTDIHQAIDSLLRRAGLLKKDHDD